jgi:hypothetical protein
VKPRKSKQLAFPSCGHFGDVDVLPPLSDWVALQVKLQFAKENTQSTSVEILFIYAKD